MSIELLSSIKPENKAHFIADRLGRAGLNPGKLLNRCHFALHPKTKLLELAVSGGADSTALLILGYLFNPNVRIWHLDHQLRPSSGAEAVAVDDLARALSVKVEIYQSKVEQGANLEERAREMRRVNFIEGVSTGHTADDLSETMLINLMRGAGPRGLGSISVGPLHPILDLRRSETESICQALSINFVVDESNSNPKFIRNRVRSELLPLLSDISQRDIVPILVRSALIFQQVADYLTSQAGAIDPTEAKQLSGADEIIATEAIRRWLADERGHTLSRELVLDVLRVARGEKVATDLPGAVRVRRSKGKLSKFDIDSTKRDHQISMPGRVIDELS
ncbi:MAG: tRNA lysidine(34) synthetase TilS [Acidimicrobiaceae bacterium]|nr:tRNA lysidine(34) synthetase TilS [Acidimicrobiaceae bacterium]